MAKENAKKRINYAYINRNLTAFGKFPAITLVLILAGLFFIFNGMFTALFVITIGGAIFLRHVNIKGATLFRYVSDMFSYYFTPVNHTPTSELDIDRNNLSWANPKSEAKTKKK